MFREDNGRCCQRKGGERERESDPSPGERKKEERASESEKGGS